MAKEDLGLIVQAENDDFNKAVKAQEEVLKDISEGKYATKEDLAKIEQDLASINDEIKKAYQTSESSVNERVAQEIAASATKNKDEVLASVREVVGDLLKGQGTTQKEVTADTYTGKWLEVEAGTREDRARNPQIGAAGRESTVIYSDIRSPLHSIEAADIASPTQGAGVQAFQPYVQLQQGDPFMEFAEIVYPTVPNFTVPSVRGSLTVTKNRAGIAANAADASDISTTGNNSADKWEVRSDFPNTTEDDMPMYRDAVRTRHMMELGATWGADVVATLKAATGFRNVNTGAARALPTVANAPAILSQMLQGLNSVYRMGAVWMLQENVEALVNQQWSNAGAAINPMTGFRMLLGYPVRVNSHLDGGATASDVSAWIGNWRVCLTEAMYRNIETRYYEETAPGDVTVYSIMRAKSVATDTNGAVKLVTAA